MVRPTLRYDCYKVNGNNRDEDGVAMGDRYEPTGASEKRGNLGERQGRTDRDGHEKVGMVWAREEKARNRTALNISTGPLALRTFQTAGPVRASTLYLSLALQDHRVKCRASRLKITVARSMTNFATFSCILFLKFRYVCIA